MGLESLNAPIARVEAVTDLPKGVYRELLETSLEYGISIISEEKVFSEENKCLAKLLYPPYSLSSLTGKDILNTTLTYLHPTSMIELPKKESIYH